jgi:hypothetical protein
MRIPLSIGDEPSAIRLIQNSQTDPYKALAELVENAIDAGAHNCVITRKKTKGQHGIYVRDDGHGFPPDDKGTPDFRRAATAICDSIKRRLPEKDRATIQGQYGIGLLGFAAIGESLTIRSRANSSKVASFQIQSGNVDANIGDPSEDPSFPQGTELHVWPIHKEVQSRLTPPKIAKYLGEELRDRIKQTNVNIIVDDPHAKTSLKVTPREFEGERLRNFDKVMSRLGSNVHFHLYVVNRGEVGQVYVSRGGTRIIDSLVDIPEFARAPWDRGLLEGYIEFKALNISPAARRGIQPDDAFAAFVQACRSIEPQLTKVLDDVEKKRKETANPAMMRKIQETFKEVMKELGAEYTWFDGPQGGRIPKELSRPGASRKGYRLSSGPLHEVRILPKIGQVRPNETKRFEARALDPEGAVIPLGVRYCWSLDEQVGSIKPSGSEVFFSAGESEDQAKLSVRAQLGQDVAEGEAVVLILKFLKPDSGVSLNLTPEHDPRGIWRSRFLKEIQQLQYNTAHPDYVEVSKKGEGRVFRYIVQLVARHLVLHNFPGASAEELMERMLETLGKIECHI